MKNRKTAIRIVTMLIAVLVTLGAVWGLLALTGGWFSGEEVSGPLVSVTVTADDSLPVDVGVSELEERDAEKYGVKYLDDLEQYVITATWKADGYDDELADIAGYSWSASYDASYGEGDGDGNGYYDGSNIASATDYAGDVWNSGGYTYDTYVAFSDTDEHNILDGYAPGDTSNFEVANTATVYAEFGTPIVLTFSIWDYSGNAPLTASVRFDCMTYYTSSSFTLYSGPQGDATESEMLFTGSYDAENGGLSFGSNTVYKVSLDKARETNAAIWYTASPAGYSVGTVCDGGAALSENDWDMEIAYNGSTYTMSSDDTASSDEEGGYVYWDNVSNEILGTTSGIGDAPIEGFRYTDLKKIEDAGEAMMTVSVKENGASVALIGLSFTDYSCIHVGISGATASVDGEGGDNVIYKGTDEEEAG